MVVALSGTVGIPSLLASTFPDKPHEIYGNMDLSLFCMGYLLP
jgi:hypothetical protein